MIRLKFFIALLFFSTIAFGQKAKSNNIYFELGGNGLFLSLNFEKELIKKTNLYGHLGFGIYGIQPTYLTLPFGINYLLKSKNKYNSIEFGLGATYTKADVKLYSIVDNKSNIPVKIQYFNIIPSISYRHNTDKNFMYKLSLTPVFNQYDGLPFLGFSIVKIF